MHADTLYLELFWKSSKDIKNNTMEGEAKGKIRFIENPNVLTPGISGSDNSQFPNSLLCTDEFTHL